jgi:hypothetical protein
VVAIAGYPRFAPAVGGGGLAGEPRPQASRRKEDLGAPVARATCVRLSVVIDFDISHYRKFVGSATPARSRASIGSGPSKLQKIGLQRPENSNQKQIFTFSM